MTISALCNTGVCGGCWYLNFDWTQEVSSVYKTVCGTNVIQQMSTV